MLIIAQSRGAHNRYIFSIFFNMKVLCVFSLKSPQRGDSNEYAQYTIFNYPLNYPNLQLWVFFFAKDSRKSSKQPISVRVTEGLLYAVAVLVDLSKAFDGLYLTNVKPKFAAGPRSAIDRAPDS